MGVDFNGIFKIYDIIYCGMHDELVAAEFVEIFHMIVAADVIDETLAYCECSAGK